MRDARDRRDGVGEPMVEGDPVSRGDGGARRVDGDHELSIAVEA